MKNLFKAVLILLTLALLPAISQAQCTDSTDIDNDGIIACEDNCPYTYNPDQIDADSNGYGRACDEGEYCCGFSTGGFPGDINCGSDGKRSLADITILIDQVYINKQPPCCFENSDLNQDSIINLADITMLIDHIYIRKQEFAPCGG